MAKQLKVFPTGNLQSFISTIRSSIGYNDLNLETDDMMFGKNKYLNGVEILKQIIAREEIPIECKTWKLECMPESLGCTNWMNLLSKYPLMQCDFMRFLKVCFMYLSGDGNDEELSYDSFFYRVKANGYFFVLPCCLMLEIFQNEGNSAMFKAALSYKEVDPQKHLNEVLYRQQGDIPTVVTIDGEQISFSTKEIYLHEELRPLLEISYEQEKEEKIQNNLLKEKFTN